MVVDQAVVDDTPGRSKQADNNMMKLKCLVLGLNVFTDWGGNDLKVVLFSVLDRQLGEVTANLVCKILGCIDR